MKEFNLGCQVSSPAKRYKVSQRRVIVGLFDREALRRRMYQLYEAKQHVTLSQLLVTILCFTVIILWSILPFTTGCVTGRLDFYRAKNIATATSEGDGIWVIN